jgi:hypothetical protein
LDPKSLGVIILQPATMGIPQYNSESEDAPQSTGPEQLIARFGRLHTLDDLIRLRAADAVQHPILAYPQSSTDDTISYEYFTGQDLDWMIDQTASTLIDCGFKPVSPPCPKNKRAILTHMMEGSQR